MGYVLGLGGPYYHDASACLVDGQGAIVAFAEEERFTRTKHNAYSRSSTQSAAYCLARHGLRLEDIDEIAIAWNPHWPEPLDSTTDRELVVELLHPSFFHGHVPRRLTVVNHHLAHAASAFYPSGFPDAAVLVVDGAGDAAATSIYHGTPDGLRLLHQYPFTQSLGWFYETVTEHLGIGEWTSAGKLMGLAAYGRPVHEFPCLRADEDGYRIDLSRYGLGRAEETAADYRHLDYYHALKRAYGKAFTDVGVPAHRRTHRYDAASGRMVSDTGFTPGHADLAASAQHTLVRCLLALARRALAETGTTRLCLAGGVGLNCAANGELYRHSGADDLFVQPAAGDAGTAIGAALECARRREWLGVPGPALSGTALGPAFSDDDIRAALDFHRVPSTSTPLDALALGGHLVTKTATTEGA
ncbi:carbamoyltransferase N-terminal domain-containing protein [Streptomyces huiliensis]|uniref:carbamoyltransferase N-terminal domain-containing protein n=1 Tax=Streptomyces huiliensis TaxID=2876027 RepID=UPI0027E08189|nr:carbamoyltransferase N-terminal domain-containing protein [Streptomyces huiliensis]MBZ4319452.1 hypothetical protein [Streptomyces huiliensis]